MLIKDASVLPANLHNVKISLDNNQKKKFFIDSFISDRNTDKKVLYIHNPFCIKKCSYCKYPSLEFDYKRYQTFYNEEIPKQIELYQDIFKHVKFDEVYFGGGTPGKTGDGSMSQNAL